MTEWETDKGLATDKDYTDYFNRNVVVGLELELRRKKVDDEHIPYKQLFGLESSGYSSCVLCGASECWVHAPPNLIHDIGFDGGGREFRIYGANISSEDFAQRLPLKALKDYFQPDSASGLHTHALIVNAILPIPRVIALNAFQLFRCYYLGYVWMFGNTKGSFIRSPYGSFGSMDFDSSEILSREYVTTTGVLRGMARSGIHFNRSVWINNSQLKDYMSRFDMEIRTADSTIDLSQLIGARALTKALAVRAAQLSSYGRILMPKELYERILPISRKLNIMTYNYLESEKNFMKQNAKDLVSELSPFLTSFELKCLKTLIDNPVRERTKVEQYDSPLLPPSDKRSKLKELIVLTDFSASSKYKWILQASIKLKMTPDEVAKGLEELGAKYIPEIERMVL